MAVALALATAGYGQAQQAPKAKGAPKAAQTPPQPAATPAAPSDIPTANAPPGWIARCSSAGRDTPLECAVEQSAVLSKTGQLLVLASIRVPGDTHAPVAFIQLPLGLNLPAGAKLQVDDGKVVDLQVRIWPRKPSAFRCRWPISQRHTTRSSSRPDAVLSVIARSASDEAIHSSACGAMDCFEEPVIGRAFARRVGSQ